MAYIGRQLVRGQNRVLDDISSSFNGSTTAFNLTVSSSSSPPASVNQLWIILGGVLQKPGTDFTVADAVITFTTAPASTLSFWGMIQGDTSDINSPADASVTPSKIANSGDFAFPADVRFKDADGSHYVGLQAPSTVSSNLVWSLPAADGSANQLLKTDGSGNLGWATDSATDSTKMPLAGGTFTGDITIPDKIIHDGDTNTAVRFPAADTITFETSGSERLRIDSSGSLGIGTTPETDGQANSLYFANGNANLWGSGNVNFYTCVNARYTGTAWKYNNTAAASYVGQQSGVWNFFNAPSGTADAAATFTERFRIDASGNVGINRTSPSCKLEVSDTTGSISATKVLCAEFRRDDGTRNPRLQIQHNENGTFLNHTYSTGAANLMFGIGGTEELRITGDGIKFNGDTAADNGLNDYEQGSWTPVFTRQNNSGTSYTFSNQSGKYTKIGNMFFVWFDVTLSSESGGSGVWKLSLPFTVVSGSSHGGHGVTVFRDTSLFGRLNMADSAAFAQDSNIYMYYINSSANEVAAVSVGSGRCTGQMWGYTS